MNDTLGKNPENYFCENENYYLCEKCNYTTKNKKDFKRHLISKRICVILIRLKIEGIFW